MIFVVASANPDKVEEIRQILGDAVPDLELRPRPADVADVEETGTTLEENARLKAVAIAAATGLPAIADDTGLEVAALRGAPGVRSARYAGESASYRENVAKLLGSLVDVSDRRARFRSVVMVRWPDGREISAEGVVDGRITEAPRGEGGFGYDPVFVPDGSGGKTFAELGPDKHALSHRGRALRALASKLKAEL
jgi:XTP/dITP diphosphohydrolase